MMTQTANDSTNWNDQDCLTSTLIIMLSRVLKVADFANNRCLMWRGRITAS